MPEIAEAPATEKVSPFAAALDKAFAAAPDLDAPEKVEKQADEKPPAKVEKPAEPKKEAPPKDGTPRELFRKPAAEAKPTEPDAPKSAIDEIAEPTFKDAKGKSGWEAIKKEAKTYESAAKSAEARAKELEAKLAEYEPLKGQLAEKEKLIAEQSDLVARVKVESHPDYIREFIDGRAALIKKVEGVIEDSGGDSKGVERALNLTGKARVDALSAISEDMPGFQQGRLGELVNKLTDLDERAAEKLSKSKQTYAEMQETERKREIEGRTQKFKDRLAEFDDTARRMRGQLEVLQKVDGHDAWNARADAIVAESRAYIEAHPDADPEADILARSYPVMRDLFAQADAKVAEYEKKNAELEAELKAIHSKSPSLASRGSKTPQGDVSRPFMAALKHTVGEE